MGYNYNSFLYASTEQPLKINGTTGGFFPISFNTVWTSKDFVIGPSPDFMFFGYPSSNLPINRIMITVRMLISTTKTYWKEGQDIEYIISTFKKSDIYYDAIYPSSLNDTRFGRTDVIERTLSPNYIYSTIQQYGENPGAWGKWVRKGNQFMFQDILDIERESLVSVNIFQQSFNEDKEILMRSICLLDINNGWYDLDLEMYQGGQ